MTVSGNMTVPARTSRNAPDGLCPISAAIFGLPVIEGADNTRIRANAGNVEITSS